MKASRKYVKYLKNPKFIALLGITINYKHKSCYDSVEGNRNYYNFLSELNDQLYTLDRFTEKYRNCTYLVTVLISIVLRSPYSNRYNINQDL